MAPKNCAVDKKRSMEESVPGFCVYPPSCHLMVQQTGLVGFMDCYLYHGLDTTWTWLKSETRPFNND